MVCLLSVRSVLVAIHFNVLLSVCFTAQNILLSGRLANGEYFRVKVADFDAARILKTEFTEPGLAPAGTKGFAAREVHC